MNTIWSTHLQKITTLYQTRLLRFDDRFQSLYKNAFAIDRKQSILEIGAGPGALTQALHRWYPSHQIVGSDRDTNFISFAKATAPFLTFIEADATNLPFENNSFDVTISNTVQEHVEPNKFFCEQYRVLRPGGICLVLSARRGINISSDIVDEISDFENKMYTKAEPCFEAANEHHNVGKYAMTEQELPNEMIKYGFRDIQTHYLAINLTPDSHDADEPFAINIMEANRRVHLDSLEYLPHIAPGVFTDQERKTWETEINRKYNKRIEEYKNGEKIWDVNLSLTMVVRGTKPLQ